MTAQAAEDGSDLVNLADLRFGATVLYANDDFFASKDNLLLPQRPIFIDGKYTDRGKWMDGWESKRRRVPGHDFAILRLGVPGVVRELVVDTAFFRGNFPESCSIDGASIRGYPATEALLGDDVAWTEVLPRTKLEGNSINRFKVKASDRVTHLRLNIFPDGGVARLRVYGDVLPEPKWMGRAGAAVDLAAAEHGAIVTACNDMFFGSRHNLVMPNRALDMGDGWETKRSRREGPDWVILKLAAAGVLERLVVDTLHFKGNSPESAALCVCDAGDREPSGTDDSQWTPVLPRTKLLPHTQHVFDEGLGAHRAATHARLRIWPDGGVSRLRLFGTVSDEGRERAGLAYLNALSLADADAVLLSCCGSKAFASKLAGARPFSTFAALVKGAAEVWASLTTSDWEEAFRAHPRIGEKKAAPSQGATAAAWSRGEQSRVDDASAAVLEELRKVNEAYEAKFGRTYIVCATGKTADEMLAIARARMQNAPDAELRAAADEQRKITELRLAKLVLATTETRR